VLLRQRRESGKGASPSARKLCTQQRVVQFSASRISGQASRAPGRWPGVEPCPTSCAVCRSAIGWCGPALVRPLLLPRRVEEGEGRALRMACDSGEGVASSRVTISDLAGLDAT
jgi:hypothetical protein